MRRTLIQFDEDTYRKLRQRAFRQERSLSSLVRELVEDGLEAPARKRARSLRDFSSIAAGRSRQGRSAPVSERHDDALATAFKK
jgi:hypothetical protein